MIKFYFISYSQMLFLDALKNRYAWPLWRLVPTRKTFIIESENRSGYQSTYLYLSTYLKVDGILRIEYVTINKSRLYTQKYVQYL